MGTENRKLMRMGTIVCLLLALSPLTGGAQEPEPVVHAVLFYSPTCPHCHDVITNHLIPLQNEFGHKFLILGLDTSQGWANRIFWDALRHYEVPEDRWAVPLMIVDDEVMVGGFEIPSRIRTILEEGLESGGIDLPELPSLLEFLAEQDLLDDRFPNRRIALQDPPVGTREASPAEEEPAEATGQEGPGAGSVPTADTARTTPSEDTGSPENRDSTQAGAGPEESGPVEPTPSPQAPETEDSVASAGPAEAQPPSGVGRGEEAETPGVTPGGDETAEGRQEPEGRPSEGGLGLQDAATRLESMTMWDRFNQDRAGNSLSVLVLLGMLMSLAFTGFPPKIRRDPWPRWSVPVLVLLGVGVASYLSFVEVTQVEAVCGPVGDCNTVNQSEYATLFGVLPVGILGLAGYGVVLFLWALGHWGPERLKDKAMLGLWASTLFGVFFSIYLTFLEPFVIGATCAWCLSSAVIMTLLLWAVAPEAARAWPGGTGDGNRPGDLPGVVQAD